MVKSHLRVRVKKVLEDLVRKDQMNLILAIFLGSFLISGLYFIKTNDIGLGILLIITCAVLFVILIIKSIFIDKGGKSMKALSFSPKAKGNKRKSGKKGKKSKSGKKSKKSKSGKKSR